MRTARWGYWKNFPSHFNEFNDSKEYEVIDSSSVGGNEEELMNDEETDTTSAKEHSAPFGFDDAVNIVAAIFSYNNFSMTLGHDIFEIAKILNLYPTITLPRVLERVSAWADHKGRTYKFCEGCDYLLSGECKCRNAQCARYLISQANLASSKQIITYSVRNQIQEMMDNGVFSQGVLTRSSSPSSLCSRTSRTPKYLDRLAQCEEEYPEAITFLISVNTDGFQKKGMARRNLRVYHYDTQNGDLVACTARNGCTVHMRWDSLKKYRDDHLKNGVDGIINVQAVMAHQKALNAQSQTHLKMINNSATTSNS